MGKLKWDFFSERRKYVIFLKKKFNPNTKKIVSSKLGFFLLSRNSLANFSNFFLGLEPFKTIHILLEIVKKISFFVAWQNWLQCVSP